MTLVIGTFWHGKMSYSLIMKEELASRRSCLGPKQCFPNCWGISFTTSLVSGPDGLGAICYMELLSGKYSPNSPMSPVDTSSLSSGEGSFKCTDVHKRSLGIEVLGGPDLERDRMQEMGLCCLACCQGQAQH